MANENVKTVLGELKKGKFFNISDNMYYVKFHYGNDAQKQEISKLFKEVLLPNFGAKKNIDHYIMPYVIDKNGEPIETPSLDIVGGVGIPEDMIDDVLKILVENNGVDIKCKTNIETKIIHGEYTENTGFYKKVVEAPDDEAINFGKNQYKYAGIRGKHYTLDEATDILYNHFGFDKKYVFAVGISNVLQKAVEYSGLLMGGDYIWEDDLDKLIVNSGFDKESGKFVITANNNLNMSSDTYEYTRTDERVSYITMDEDKVSIDTYTNFAERNVGKLDEKEDLKARLAKYTQSYTLAGLQLSNETHKFKAETLEAAKELKNNIEKNGVLEVVENLVKDNKTTYYKLERNGRFLTYESGSLGVKSKNYTYVAKEDEKTFTLSEPFSDVVRMDPNNIPKEVINKVTEEISNMYDCPDKTYYEKQQKEILFKTATNTLKAEVEKNIEQNKGEDKSKTDVVQEVESNNQKVVADNTNPYAKFEAENFMDVVDDYLTWVKDNTLINASKHEYYNFITDTIKNNSLVDNMKLYDEFKQRAEQNKGDKTLSLTAEMLAKYAENDVNNKMSNLSERESDELLSNLRGKISYGKGRLEGLSTLEDSVKKDEEVKYFEHRIETYSKFANELINQKEM